VAECRKHPKIYTMRMLKDNGEYSDWCPACRQWCDECEEHKAEREKEKTGPAYPTPTKNV